MEKGKKEQKGGGQQIGNERNMNGAEVDRKRISKGKRYGILGHVFEILVREKEKNSKEVWTESEQTYKGKGAARRRKMPDNISLTLQSHRACARCDPA